MNHRPFIHVNQLFNKMLALIPSNQVAGWLLIHIHRLLDLIGLEKDKTAEEVIYIIIVAGIAICLGWIIRTLILLAVRKFVMLRHNTLGKELVQHKVLIHCSHIIPPLVMLPLLPFAFTEDSLLRTIVFRILLVYTTIVDDRQDKAVNSSENSSK